GVPGQLRFAVLHFAKIYPQQSVTVHGIIIPYSTAWPGPCPAIAAIGRQTICFCIHPAQAPSRENDYRMLPDRTAVSRRTALRGLASAAAALGVGGCAGLAENGPRFGAAELVNQPTLLVATTRRPVAGARAKPWFGAERSRKITLARAMMVPP